MNDVGRLEYSQQGDLLGGSAVHFPGCHRKISNTEPAYNTYDDGSSCPAIDESLSIDDFYRFYCPPPCNPSSFLLHYSTAPLRDYVPPQGSTYHILKPPPGLGRNTPHTRTPEGPVHYGMSLAGADVTHYDEPEWAVECHKKTCSTYESYREQRPIHGQGLDHSVMCNVKGGGKMVVQNHCSSGPVHTMVAGHSTANSSDLTSSSRHYFTQRKDDGPPVSSGQLSTRPSLSSTRHPPIYPPSTSMSFARGHTVKPEAHGSQFHKPSFPVRTTNAGVSSERQAKRSKCASWEKLRKPCNCTKSRCLKLYCDCFASGEVCKNCKCINCCNNLAHNLERRRAVKMCLDRNPEAFHPKIGNRKLGELSGHHSKGCNCKRSGCLKNYCECYEAKIMCSDSCKCVGCQNYESSCVRKSTAVCGTSATYHNAKGPLMCITPDVVEATCGCLLAQAEEAEEEGHTLHQAERMILKEFGQCLTQIVGSIFKSANVR